MLLLLVPRALTFITSFSWKMDLTPFGKELFIYRACVIDWLSPISCSMMIQMIMNERLSGRGWIAVACTDRLVISLDVGCGSEWLAWPALLNGGKFGTAFPLLALVYTRQDRRGIPYHVVYFQRNYALELHSY